MNQSQIEEVMSDLINKGIAAYEDNRGWTCWLVMLDGFVHCLRLTTLVKDIDKVKTKYTRGGEIAMHDPSGIETLRDTLDRCTFTTSCDRCILYKER
jgi:hypothetical protein